MILKYSLVFLYSFLSIFFPLKVLSFNSKYKHNYVSLKTNNKKLLMKWEFSKGQGSLPDLGGRGTQGEYYFIPTKKANLKAPAEALGKEISLPIFPRSAVLGPAGEEELSVYEMRYRQMINEIGEGGVFGHVYYSQENSKLALVGTLARLKKIQRLEDGGIYIVMEGIGKFYIREIKKEKPYLRANVQIFTDYIVNEKLLEPLEEKLLNEIRYSVKLMKLLYPQNNYTINDLVLKNRPTIQSDTYRTVKLPNQYSETVRRSKFSFATMEMLKTDPLTKLVFLQEPILEKRYANMLKVLQDSTLFLENEFKRRGLIINEEGERNLRKDTLKDISDLETIPKASWIPQNFIDGDWKMQPIVMD